MNGIEFLGTKQIPIPKRKVPLSPSDNSEILNTDDFSFNEFLEKFDKKNKYVKKKRTNQK